MMDARYIIVGRRWLAWGVLHEAHGLVIGSVCWLPDGDRPDTAERWTRLPWLDQPRPVKG